MALTKPPKEPRTPPNPDPEAKVEGTMYALFYRGCKDAKGREPTRIFSVPCTTSGRHGCFPTVDAAEAAAMWHMKRGIDRYDDAHVFYEIYELKRTHFLRGTLSPTLTPLKEKP